MAFFSDISSFSLPFFWFGFAVSCLFCELIFPGLFYFLSCACAATLVSVIVLYYPTITIAYQLFIFFFLCLLFFISLQKIVIKKFASHKDKYKSHLFSLISSEGEVILDISENSAGQVRIKNEIWPAYLSEKNGIIKKGQKIIVVEISGASLFVKEKK